MIYITFTRFSNSSSLGVEKEIILTSNNFNEAVYKFEEIAMDYLLLKKGNDDLKILKNLDGIKSRGFYAVGTRNKITIYQKLKNGWIYSGEFVKLVEFELFYTSRLHREENGNSLREERKKSEMTDYYKGLFLDVIESINSLTHSLSNLNKECRAD